MNLASYLNRQYVDENYTIFCHIFFFFFKFLYPILIIISLKCTAAENLFVFVRVFLFTLTTDFRQILVITLPKKDNLQLCQNCKTSSLISHPSKVMLKITLNRLQPQAEEIIAEEQAGFRAGRSHTEQIFSLRILGEKYLQHQQNLYHVFIDVKKALDRVWHEALWATMRKYNIKASIIRVIENLYDKAQSAVRRQHRRMVQNYSRSSTRVSTLTNPI